MQTQQRGKYELCGGYVVAMVPERAVHARAKAELWLAFRNAIRAADLPCNTFYKRDMFVRCGERLAGDQIETNDPLIIVEVISPSSTSINTSINTGTKLADYFRLPSLRHYLVVELTKRHAVHHVRDEAGNVTTHILAGGTVRFDPPGLEFDLGDILDAID